MQSEQAQFDITPSPAPSSRPATGPAPSAPDASPDYIPRTVWQTPHGLAPTFTRSRSTRLPSVPNLVRRSFRLMFRLRRLALRRTAVPGLWPQRGLSVPS
ncbi:MAG: hypothetical protein RL522_1551 [Pseudomonadota bacterium]